MLPLSEYYNHPLGRFGKQPRCKACCRLEASKSRRRYTDSRKARRYGVSREFIRHLLAVPVCQACGDRFAAFGKERLDHCHERSHMRGVLCHACNITCQGSATEALSRMRSCIGYLERDLQWQSLGESQCPG